MGAISASVPPHDTPPNFLFRNVKEAEYRVIPTRTARPLAWASAAHPAAGGWTFGAICESMASCFASREAKRP